MSDWPRPGCSRATVFPGLGQESGVTVMLAGGPRDLPTESHVQRVASLADMVKLPFGSGYEHFRHQADRGSRCGVRGWRDAASPQQFDDLRTRVMGVLRVEVEPAGRGAGVQQD